MNKEDKELIVAAARKEVGPSSNNGGLCLQLSLAVGRELARRGIRAVLQAGSAQWRCMGGDDDGVSPTHFAYMWEMSLLTKQRIAAGLMPEMHCWIGIPATQEIVDISTRDLIEQARLRAGIIWTADPPPDYIWTNKEEGFPCDARYIVDPVATAVALYFAESL